MSHGQEFKGFARPDPISNFGSFRSGLRDQDQIQHRDDPLEAAPETNGTPEPG